MSEYSGWTNYETWCCNLWLTNDQGTSEELSELACSDGDRHGKTEILKAQIQEFMPELPASLYSDLLQAAMDEINFHEIIENHEDDIEPDGEDEDEPLNGYANPL